MAKAKKLPSGKWRVQASATINGQKVRRSFTDTDRKTAEIKANQWQIDKSKQESKSIILQEAYNRYIEAKQNVLSPNTVRGYRNLAKNALQDIMCIKVEELTSEQIQRSINIFSASHSAKSVRNCNGLLSAVLKMFRPNFVLNVTLPQKEKTNLYIPTDEDIKRLIDVTKDTNLYIPILLAAFGGLRQGEICALTDKDVKETYITVNKSMSTDNNGGWIIKPPKTYSSNRKVELPPFIIDELKQIKGNIVKTNPHALAIAFGRILKKHNIPHFRFHDLRHYFVSSLHSIGIPDKYIMAQGGWSTNYTMQTVYNHILANKQSEFSHKTTEHFSNIING